MIYYVVLVSAVQQHESAVSIHLSAPSCASSPLPPLPHRTPEHRAELPGTYIQWNATQPIKRNRIESFALMWTDLESVIQSEVSQKEKYKYGILIHIYDDLDEI